MKYSGVVGRGRRKNRLDFGGDLRFLVLRYACYSEKG